MRFKATLSNLHSMIAYIKKQALQVGFDEADVHKIQLASEEALVNIIHYAYPSSHKNGEIEVICYPQDGHSLQIVFKDQGIAFNPLDKGEVNIHAPIEQRRIGGLGIFFFLKVMDDLEYKRDGKWNILVMTKRVLKFA